MSLVDSLLTVDLGMYAEVGLCFIGVLKLSSSEVLSELLGSVLSSIIGLGICVDKLSEKDMALLWVKRSLESVLTN